MAAASEAVAQAARALLEAARGHKHAAGQSRRAARKCMQDLEKLRAMCLELGLKFDA